jgi:hypothetical protein
MPDEESNYLFNVAKKLSTAVFDAVSAQGTNILQRNGQVAGQEAPHVHVHVIPRFENDNVGLLWQPKKLSEEEFTEVQNKIIEKAKSISFEKKKVVYDMSGQAVDTVEARTSPGASGDTKRQEKEKSEDISEVKPRLP